MCYNQLQQERQRSRADMGRSCIARHSWMRAIPSHRTSQQHCSRVIIITLPMLREAVLPQVDQEFAARILASLAQVMLTFITNWQSLPAFKVKKFLIYPSNKKLVCEKLNHWCFSCDMTPTFVTLSFILVRVSRKILQFLPTGKYAKHTMPSEIPSTTELLPNQNYSETLCCCIVGGLDWVWITSPPSL